MGALWRIEMLGGLRAVVHGQEITRFRTQKAALLLAYLAHRLEHVPREVLVAQLWPEADEESARARLRVELSSLRRQLESPGIQAGTVLISDRASVRLNPEAATTDVTDFLASLRAAEEAGDAAGRMAHLERAVALYRGDFLPGYYEEWVIHEQRHLSDLFFEAAGELIADLVRSGDPEQAVGIARRAVQVDPLREQAHRDLVRALSASGRTEAALRQVEQMRAILSEKLGVTSSESAESLLAEIRQDAPTWPEQPERVLGPTEQPERAGEVAAVSLPAGTVTILMVRAHPGATGVAEAAGSVVKRYEGVLLRVSGPEAVLAFSRAGDALAAAAGMDRCLAPGSLQMALHTGDVEPNKGGYPGRVLRRATVLLRAAQPGQTLCSEVTATLLRSSSAATALADLGRFRLPDADSTEHLFQVVSPGAEPKDFPPPNLTPAFEDRLPPTFTRFFGREEDIDRITRMVTEGGRRLVTLTGPGGSGKTRLSLAVARHLQPYFHQAVWFVPLADLSDPERIPDAFVSALGLTPKADEDPLERAAAFLGQQPSLIVLDNLEHLVDGGAEIVHQLRGRVPDLTLLCTSRRVLSLPGEREYPVPLLPVPRLASTLEEAILLPSILLFVDRAQAALPDFQVTPGSIQAVTELCRRLDGIPLAIELAASRARLLTPTRMLEKLSERFVLLASRRKGGPERHRTMEAAIDWSYDLLSEDERRCFRRLSVFRGGWTEAATQVVCDEPRAGSLLDDLVDASLVRIEVTDEGPRYRMLETLREYGWERLSAEERDETRQRHLEYFADYAEKAMEVYTTKDRMAWLAQLRAEHDNLRAAMEFGLAREPDTAVRIAVNLARFWDAQSGVREGHAWYSRLLERLADITPQWRVRLLREAGWNAYMKGDLDKAYALLSEAVLLWRSLGSPTNLAAVLTSTGQVATYLGRYEEAQRYLAEALSISEARGNRVNIADISMNLGCLAESQANYPEARMYMEKALTMYRQLGDRGAVGQLLSNLCSIAMDTGDLDAAVPFGEDGVAALREVNDSWSLAAALMNLGMCHRLRGEHGQARQLLEESQRISQETDNRICMAYALNQLGGLDLEEGDLAEARQRIWQAVRLSRETNHTLCVAECLISAIRLAKASRQPAYAARLLGVVDAILAPLGRSTDEMMSPAECDDLRDALGDAAFTDARLDGGRIPLEDAIPQVLAFLQAA